MSEMVGQDMITGMGFIGTEPGMYRMTPPYTYGEAEGTAICVESKAGPFKGMRVLGRTEQVTTTGKNLLKNEVAPQIINGITVTVSDDGVITLNGTTTGMTYIDIDTEFDSQSLEGAIFSGFPDDYSFIDVNSSVILRVSSKSDRTALQDFNANNEKILNNGTGLLFAIRIYKGLTLNNFVLKPMIRNVNVSDSAYEPYTGGIPSPNPDYTQELVSVSGGGSIEVEVLGKNLFDYETIKEYGWSDGKAVETETGITLYASGGWHLSLFDTSKFAGQKMTVNCKWKVNIDKSTDTDDTYCLFGIVSVPSISYPKDNQIKLVRSKVSTEYETVSVTFTADMFTGFFVRLSKEGVSLKRVYSIQDIQFSIGDQNGKYEKPLPVQTVSLSTTNGLPGIPVTSASLANYTDADGQMWCCDEIDLDRGVYIQRIWKEVFDGNRTYFKSSSSNKNGIPFAHKFSKPVKTYVGGICNNRRFYNGNIGGINTYEFCIYGSPYNYAGFCSPTSDTVESFTAEMESNPATILCILETPIETPLSATELTSYRALRTNKPVTTIFNDANANMKVKYRKER